LARQGLAGSLSRAGRFADSNVELQRILKAQPQWEHADQIHINLGANYERLGDRPNAIREYQKTLELNPKFDAARQRLRVLSPGQ
jgi:tetratricopeptide (TPR) repeat protein